MTNRFDIVSIRVDVIDHQSLKNQPCLSNVLLRVRPT